MMRPSKSFFLFTLRWKWSLILLFLFLVDSVQFLTFFWLFREDAFGSMNAYFSIGWQTFLVIINDRSSKHVIFMFGCYAYCINVYRSVLSFVLSQALIVQTTIHKTLATSLCGVSFSKNSRYFVFVLFKHVFLDSLFLEVLVCWGC